jgi:hypothetical protein
MEWKPPGAAAADFDWKKKTNTELVDNYNICG